MYSVLLIIFMCGCIMSVLELSDSATIIIMICNFCTTKYHTNYYYIVIEDIQLHINGTQIYQLHTFLTVAVFEMHAQLNVHCFLNCNSITLTLLLLFFVGRVLIYHDSMIAYYHYHDCCSLSR